MAAPAVKVVNRTTEVAIASRKLVPVSACCVITEEVSPAVTIDVSPVGLRATVAAPATQVVLRASEVAVACGKPVPVPTRSVVAEDVELATSLGEGKCILGCGTDRGPGGWLRVSSLCAVELQAIHQRATLHLVARDDTGATVEIVSTTATSSQTLEVVDQPTRADDVVMLVAGAPPAPSATAISATLGEHLAATAPALNGVDQASSANIPVRDVFSPRAG